VLICGVECQNHVDEKETVEYVVSHFPVSVRFRKCDTIRDNQTNNDEQKCYKHIPFQLVRVILGYNISRSTSAFSSGRNKVFIALKLGLIASFCPLFFIIF
jgi:hypothetical protein